MSVCSPPRYHVEQALACAREERIVFVEKPVAVTRRELARLTRAPGCVPVVQWRWGRAIRAVRRAIGLGIFGAAPSLSVDLAWRREAAYFRARAGWGCGALLSVGIHALDAACYALDRAIVGLACVRQPRLERNGARAPEVRDEPGGDEESVAVLLATFAGGPVAALRVTFAGGPDETRLSFCGGGVTAAIVGSEADPTASAVVWRCADAPTLGLLEEIERSTDGAVQPPLIVPFLGRALAAWRRGELPGQSDALPSIRDVLAAHDVALRGYESPMGGAPARPLDFMAPRSSD